MKLFKLFNVGVNCRKHFLSIYNTYVYNKTFFIGFITSISITYHLISGQYSIEEIIFDEY